jgi:hypothetical protein
MSGKSCLQGVRPLGWLDRIDEPSSCFVMPESRHTRAAGAPTRTKALAIGTRCNSSSPELSSISRPYALLQVTGFNHDPTVGISDAPLCSLANAWSRWLLWHRHSAPPFVAGLFGCHRCAEPEMSLSSLHVRRRIEQSPDFDMTDLIADIGSEPAMELDDMIFGKLGGRPAEVRRR